MSLVESKLIVLSISLKLHKLMQTPQQWQPSFQLTTAAMLTPNSAQQPSFQSKFIIKTALVLYFL